MKNLKTFESFNEQPKKNNNTYNDDVYDLFYSILHNNINNVKKYIDSGNDLDIMNDRGNTPLTYACYHGMPKIVELLLNSGVDVNKKK